MNVIGRYCSLFDEFLNGLFDDLSIFDHQKKMHRQNIHLQLIETSNELFKTMIIIISSYPMLLCIIDWFQTRYNKDNIWTEKLPIPEIDFIRKKILKLTLLVIKKCIYTQQKTTKRGYLVSIGNVLCSFSYLESFLKSILILWIRP
jgi:hypothetical protein